MRRQQIKIIVVMGVLLSFPLLGCEERTDYYSEPGYTGNEYYRDLPDGDLPDRALDAGVQEEPFPQCWVEGVEKCAYCIFQPDQEPVVSCPTEPPTDDLCQLVSSEGVICEVCMDPEIGVTHDCQDEKEPDECRTTTEDTQDCPDEKEPGPCRSTTENNQVCLICGTANNEKRECRPQKQSCSTQSTAEEVCLICVDESGAQLSKTCQPVSQTCSVTSIADLECLICVNNQGAVISTLCEIEGD